MIGIRVRGRADQQRRENGQKHPAAGSVHIQAKVQEAVPSCLSFIVVVAIAARGPTAETELPQSFADACPTMPEGAVRSLPYGGCVSCNTTLAYCASRRNYSKEVFAGHAP